MLLSIKRMATLCLCLVASVPIYPGQTFSRSKDAKPDIFIKFDKLEGALKAANSEVVTSILSTKDYDFTPADKEAIRGVWAKTKPSWPAKLYPDPGKYDSVEAQAAMANHGIKIVKVGAVNIAAIFLPLAYALYKNDFSMITARNTALFFTPTYLSCAPFVAWLTDSTLKGFAEININNRKKIGESIKEKSQAGA